MKIKRVWLIAAIVFLGGALRLHGAMITVGEWDEDDYLVPAAEYHKAIIIDGQPLKAIDIERNYEHPPLVKILYGLTVDSDEINDFPTELFRGERADLPPNSERNARLQSIAAGTLTVLVVAIISPLAGFLLAINSMHQHYTSVAYLDGLPVLLTAIMGILYERARTTSRTFWLSAASFGLAVACKYPFGLIGFIVIAHALFFRRFKLWQMVAWGLLAVLVFFAFNPYLWNDAINRLEKQLTYHDEYKEGYQAKLYKPFQQFAEAQRRMHDTDGEYLYPQIVDVALLIPAFIGVVMLLRRRSVWGWWWVGGFAFLMVWPTQWMQHNLMVSVPYMFSVALGLQALWGYGRMQINRRWTPQKPAQP